MRLILKLAELKEKKKKKRTAQKKETKTKKLQQLSEQDHRGIKRLVKPGIWLIQHGKTNNKRL